MFKSLMGLAMAVPALAGVTKDTIKEDLADTQCQALTTSSGTVFSIGDIEGVDDYSVNVKDDGVSGYSLVFNYCTFVEGTTGTYGIYRKLGDKSKDVVVANKAIKAFSAENLRDADGNTNGVTFTQESSTTCKGETKYSMTTELYCKEGVTNAGSVRSVTLKDECEFVVVMDHKEGCPDVNVDVDKYMGWLEENEWVVGIIYVVVGPLIALFGTQLFPWVSRSRSKVSSR